MALILFLGGAFTNSSYYWARQKGQIAQVNGTPIQRTEFVRAYRNAQRSYMQQGLNILDEKNAVLKDVVRQATLETLIQQQLVRDYAREHQITVSSDEIDTEVKKFVLVQHKGDIERFEKQLRGNGLTMSTFREQVRDHLLSEKTQDQVTQNVKLSNKVLQDYYEAHKSEYAVPEKIEVQHILIKPSDKRPEAEAKKRAEQVIADYKAGASFDSLVKKYSEDTSSNEAKGKLSAFGKGEMEAAFEKAAWALKPGELSPEPVKTGYGYHVILRGKTLPAHTLSLKEAKIQFEDRLLLEEKKKAFQDWSQRQRAAANVEVLPEFQPQESASPGPAASSSTESAQPSTSASPKK